MHPKLRYKNQMFGAHELMMRPKNAVNVQAIVTTRQPSLLVRALTSGPEHESVIIHRVSKKTCQQHFWSVSVKHEPIAMICMF